MSYNNLFRGGSRKTDRVIRIWCAKRAENSFMKGVVVNLAWSTYGSTKKEPFFEGVC